MAETNTISYKDMIGNNNESQEWEKINFKKDEILVKKHLDLVGVESLINEAVDMCFINRDVDKSEEEYHPSLKDFSFKYHILLFYTNITFDGDINEVYKFVMYSGIYDMVSNSIGIDEESNLWEVYCEALNKKITDKADDGSLEGILKKISSILNTVQKKVENEDIVDLLQYFKDDFSDFRDGFDNAVEESIKEAKQ